jgi:polyphenol oxidase
MKTAPAMTLPDPFYKLGEHVGIDLSGARALFTTRRGGFSEGPYASLNLGRLTDDRADAVRRNRSRLQELVGAKPAHIRQVHGTLVRPVTAADDEFVAPLPEGDIKLPIADGQATRLRGVAPMVLTADCLPIALAGSARPGAEDGAAVAMLHAGWRGLAGGIVAEGVRAIREIGAEGPLEAAIGPGAGCCCYEVGEVFAAHGDGVRHGRNLDLKAIARWQLEHAGVETVHDVELCTICADAALFFSHRRDRGVTGRQAGLVWLS